MIILHAIELLKLKLSNPIDSKPKNSADPNTLISSVYTNNNTCRLLLTDQIPQTHLISSDKLRFIIITAITLADLISIY